MHDQLFASLPPAAFFHPWPSATERGWSNFFSFVFVNTDSWRPGGCPRTSLGLPASGFPATYGPTYGPHQRVRIRGTRTRERRLTPPSLPGGAGGRPFVPISPQSPCRRPCHGMTMHALLNVRPARMSCTGPLFRVVDLSMHAATASYACPSRLREHVAIRHA